MSEYWVAGQSKVSMQTAIQTSGAPTCGDGASRAANRERSARVAQNIFEVSSVAEKTMPPDEAGERRSTSAEEDVFHRRSNRLEAPAARALPEQTLEESVVRRFPTEERDERIHLVSAARAPGPASSAHGQMLGSGSSTTHRLPPGCKISRRYR